MKEVVTLDGTKQQVLQKASGELLEPIRDENQLRNIAQLLQAFHVGWTEESEYYIAAIEIAETVKADKALWNKAAKYSRYVTEKLYYEEQLKAFSATWKGIKLKEEKEKRLRT